MLATLVYLADIETENFCSMYSMQAGKNGLSVASAALPRHISLGTPYPIEDFTAYLRLTDQIAEQIPPLSLRLTILDAKQSMAGPVPMSWLGFHFMEEPVLDQIRREIADYLQGNGITVIENDTIIGSRNITLLTDQTPFSQYQQFLATAPRSHMGRSVFFNKLGVFFYDSDTYGIGSYFCCKQYMLTKH